MLRIPAGHTSSREFASSSSRFLNLRILDPGSLK